jgi:hypothetical protein
MCNFELGIFAAYEQFIHRQIALPAYIQVAKILIEGDFILF